jgi:hypothetical protein
VAVNACKGAWAIGVGTTDSPSLSLGSSHEVGDRRGSTKFGAIGCYGLKSGTAGGESDRNRRPQPTAASPAIAAGTV